MEIWSEIKFRADQICKELLDANALYDFKNVCDKTNNTDYIIDLQMGVLDTYIEIIKGMGIIVNNITILKPMPRSHNLVLREIAMYNVHKITPQLSRVHTDMWVQISPAAFFFQKIYNQ